MTRDQLRARIYSRIDELPTLPTVVVRVLGLVESETSNAGDVTAAIAQDPALTAKLLKVANSAYYGFRREVASVERAVALLGFHMVRSLTVSIGVVQSLGASPGTPAFSREGLWAHSLAVATAMKHLAGHAGQRPDAESLFITGLLHDVGRVALDQFFPEEFGAALRASAENQTPLYLAEREQVGADHGEVGGLLLGRWNFPEAIREPVAVHHREEASAAVDPAAVALLRVADAVAQQTAVGSSGNPAPPQPDPADLAVLGLRETDVAAALEHLENAAEGIRSFSGALS